MSVTERLGRPVANTTTIAAVGIAVAAFITVAANYDIQPGENGGVVPGITTGVGCLVVAAVLFGYVLPRVQNVERTTLILGSIAFVATVAFWSGVGPILAAAAVAVARRSEAPGRRAMVGQALGIVGAVAALAITVAQSHLF